MPGQHPGNATLEEAADHRAFAAALDQQLDQSAALAHRDAGLKRGDIAVDDRGHGGSLPVRPRRAKKRASSAPSGVRDSLPPPSSRGAHDASSRGAKRRSDPVALGGPAPRLAASHGPRSVPMFGRPCGGLAPPVAPPRGRRRDPPRATEQARPACGPSLFRASPPGHPPGAASVSTRRSGRSVTRALRMNGLATGAAAFSPPPTLAPRARPPPAGAGRGRPPPGLVTWSQVGPSRTCRSPSSADSLAPNSMARRKNGSARAGSSSTQS